MPPPPRLTPAASSTASRGRLPEVAARRRARASTQPSPHRRWITPRCSRLADVHWSCALPSPAHRASISNAPLVPRQRPPPPRHRVCSGAPPPPRLTHRRPSLPPSPRAPPPRSLPARRRRGSRARRLSLRVAAGAAVGRRALSRRRRRLGLRTGSRPLRRRAGVLLSPRARSARRAARGPARLSHRSPYTSTCDRAPRRAELGFARDRALVASPRHRAYFVATRSASVPLLPTNSLSAPRQPMALLPREVPSPPPPPLVSALATYPPARYVVALGARELHPCVPCASLSAAAGPALEPMTDPLSHRESTLARKSRTSQPFKATILAAIAVYSHSLLLPLHVRRIVAMREHWSRHVRTNGPCPLRSNRSPLPRDATTTR